jgi:hypothetical protein
MYIIQEVGIPIFIVYIAICVAASQGVNIHAFVVSVDILEKIIRIFFFIHVVGYLAEIQGGNAHTVSPITLNISGSVFGRT